MLTGRYQQRFGFEFNTGPARITFEERGGLPFGKKTIADLVSSMGYSTGMIGKRHLGNSEGYHPSERGFSESFGFLAGARPYFDQTANGENASTRRGASKHPQARLHNIERISELNALYRVRERISEPEYLTDALAPEAVD